MKKKFQKCENCEELTGHSIKKVQSPHKGLKREVTKCDECGKTTIKSRRKGSYTIGGKNE